MYYNDAARLTTENKGGELIDRSYTLSLHNPAFSYIAFSKEPTSNGGSLCYPNLLLELPNRLGGNL